MQLHTTHLSVKPQIHSRLSWLNVSLLYSYLCRNFCLILWTHVPCCSWHKIVVTPLGHGVTPPGHGVTPPGHGVTPPGRGDATGSWWRRRRRRVVMTPLGHGDAAGSWWRCWVVVTPPGRDDATGSWWQWIVVITGCNCWVLNSGSAGFTSHPQLLYTNYVLAHSAWPSLRVDEITTDTIILG